MVLLWLTMLLTWASCLPQTIQDPNSPIKNLRVDPESERLTWDLNGNVSKIECIKDSIQHIEAMRNMYCHIDGLSLCTVSNYTVRASEPPFSTWILFPEPDGKPEAAAENLSCLIHDVDFITCNWTVGQGAPSDVQYHLYSTDVDTREQRECLHYRADARGTHISCRFDNISKKFKYFHNYVIVVNGSSKDARIPCTDITISDLSRIEKLSMPQMTTKCNKTHSLMTWKMRSHFNTRFIYELQIQQGTEPAILETVKHGTSFLLPNPGRYTVKIRAQEVYDNLLSEWSAPQHFVCDPEEPPQARTWRVSLLIALGALLALLLALVLCRRYSVAQKIFPPIPRMKDPISDHFPNDKLMAWEAGTAEPEDCTVTEVRLVKET
ncbi:interleukin-3 receptor subunit alpha [Otolemur garnettii]|uniref:interleukin-3 receptor subunit alpha n=1 Tax=Otolemur garnettii TaxID=30611 RepID=UPI0006442B24|nr:interleukin-3 receptor subunit alpha [Otolemur garnettii]